MTARSSTGDHRRSSSQGKCGGDGARQSRGRAEGHGARFWAVYMGFGSCDVKQGENGRERTQPELWQCLNVRLKISHLLTSLYTPKNGTRSHGNLCPTSTHFTTAPSSTTRGPTFLSTSVLLSSPPGCVVSCIHVISRGDKASDRGRGMLHSLW